MMSVHGDAGSDIGIRSSLSALLKVGNHRGSGGRGGDQQAQLISGISGKFDTAATGDSVPSAFVGNLGALLLIRTTLKAVRPEWAVIMAGFGIGVSRIYRHLPCWPDEMTS